MNGPERYDIPPERLERWLDRWVELHGEIAGRSQGPERLTLTAADGAVLECDPPFPPLTGKGVEGLLAHVRRDRVVAVLLVRLGGHAAGVFSGRRLVDSKVDNRFVKGRHKKGGSSANRFRRRREEQERDLIEAAAAETARILGPWRDKVEHGALGGDRTAVGRTLAERPDLEWLDTLALERFFDVPDPRLRVLEGLPYQLYAAKVVEGD